MAAISATANPAMLSSRASVASRRGMKRSTTVGVDVTNRRAAGLVRAVQTPIKPSVREATESQPIFPKSAVQSRQNVKPASETFKKAYSDYSTGYASVPGLSYERSEWITEVGLCKLQHPVETHSACKAHGFNTWAYDVKTWFPKFAFTNAQLCAATPR
jgi:hypothetical protein